MNPIQTKNLLARQGIYNKKGSLCAYELLYRDNEESKATINNYNLLEGTAATSSVITQLFSNLDINSIIGNKPAYINFTHNHLVEKIPRLLPKHRVVIEILETTIVDSSLITNVTELHKEGYVIALDDFVYKEEFLPLVALADIIKIDVLSLNKEQIEKQIAPLKTRFHGKFLAEKIETKAQLNDCIDLGFDYFQGFMFNKPEAVTGQPITEHKLYLLRLLAELNNENVVIAHIEEMILQIPRLSYRLLRLANSASLYLNRKIESVMDAIIQLGLLQIRNWLHLFLLASLDDVFPDLLERTLIRAKMCESLAKRFGNINPHQAHMMGIFSTLDEMFHEPMESLLAKVQLSDILNAALLNHEGEMGTILKWCICYEKAHFSQLENIPVSKDDLVDAYLQGIQYAQSAMSFIE